MSHKGAQCAAFGVCVGASSASTLCFETVANGDRTEPVDFAHLTPELSPSPLSRRNWLTLR